MKGVLFLCTGNACRSQMAEGFARRLAPEGVAVHSAGTAPAGLNPRAVSAMNELGIDIAPHRSKDLSAVPLDEVDLVITLCGNADETCPTLPAGVQRLHWPLPDPAAATGEETEITQIFREVRDAIADRVSELFASR